VTDEPRRAHRRSQRSATDEVGKCHRRSRRSATDSVAWQDV